jgi:ABC-2 type transport system permease protein
MGESGAIGNYDTAKIMFYYALVMIIKKLTVSNVGYGISSDIHSGRLSFYLLKPYAYSLYKISQDISSRITVIMQSALSLLVFCFIIFGLLHQSYSVNIALLTPVIIINACILNFLASYLIGILGFWTVSVWAVFLLYETIANSLGGVLFPLDIVPAVLRPLFNYLPFYYMYFFPVTSLTGGFEGNTANSILVQYLWMAILFAATVALNRSGIKRYEAVGI